MSEAYSRMEEALMELDRAVSKLARQAEQIKIKLATPARSPSRKGITGDLFALLTAPGTQQGPNEDGIPSLDMIERKLDLTIAQIEDLLDDDRQSVSA